MGKRYIPMSWGDRGIVGGYSGQGLTKINIPGRASCGNSLYCGQNPLASDLNRRLIRVETGWIPTSKLLKPKTN
jgi:hypothetical protein